MGVDLSIIAYHKQDILKPEKLALRFYNHFKIDTKYDYSAIANDIKFKESNDFYNNDYKDIDKYMLSYNHLLKNPFPLICKHSGHKFRNIEIEAPFNFTIRLNKDNSNISYWMRFSQFMNDKNLQKDIVHLVRQFVAFFGGNEVMYLPDNIACEEKPEDMIYFNNLKNIIESDYGIEFQYKKYLYKKYFGYMEDEFYKIENKTFNGFYIDKF